MRLMARWLWALALTVCVSHSALAQDVPGKDANGKTDLYGDPLPPGALLRLGTVRLRAATDDYTGQGVGYVGISADGSVVASATGVGSVLLWDGATGARLRRIEGHGGMTLSPDGKCLATGFGLRPDTLAGDTDTTVAIIDVATGAVLHKIPARPVLLAISPDSTLLAAISGEDVNLLRLWNLRTGAAVRDLKGNTGGMPQYGYSAVTSIAFSGDGRFVATGGGSMGTVSNNNAIRIYNVATGELVKTLPGHVNPGRDQLGRPMTASGRVNCVALSRDGKLVASSGSSKSILIHEVATGRQLHALKMENEAEQKEFSPRKVVFTPDDKNVITADSTHMRVWEVDTGRQAHAFEGPPDDGYSLTLNRGAVTMALSANGRWLVYGSGNMTVYLWDVKERKSRFDFAGPESVLGRSVFSPDGKVIAVAGSDEVVRLFDAATGRQVRVLRGHRNGVVSLAFSPDGRTLVSAGCHDDTVRTDKAKVPNVRGWDMETGAQRFATQLDRLGTRIPEIPGSLAFAPDGKTFAIGGTAIYVFDAKDGSVLSVQRHGVSRHSLCMAPDGRAFATADHSGTDRVFTIRLSHPQTLGSLAASDPEPGQCSRLRFHPQGRVLAVAAAPPGGGSRICFFNAATAAKLGEWPGMEIGRGSPGCASIRDIAFSPDGRYLAVAAADKTVRLCEVASAQEVLQYKGHAKDVTGVEFSPDGARLASSSEDATVLVWQIGPVEATGAAPAKLTPDQLRERWSQLADEAAPAAFRAIWDLIRSGDQAVELIATNLKPVQAEAGAAERLQARIQLLIAQLDDRDYERRDAASAALVALGELAQPAMREALKNPASEEARVRLTDALRRVDANTPMCRLKSLEQRQIVRAVEVLERVASPVARRHLEALAAGAQDALQTREAKVALNRLSAH